MYVNLLPQSFQRDLVFRQRFLQWSLAWAVTAIVLLLLCGAEFIGVICQRTLLADAQLKCLPTRRIQAQVSEVKQQLTAARAEQTRLKDLLSDHRAFAALAIVSQAVQGVQRKIHLQNLQFHCPHNYPSLQDKATHPAMTHGHIQIQGLAGDDDAIAAFIDALRHVSVIAHVELKSSSHWSVAGSDERKFEIVCKL